MPVNSTHPEYDKHKAKWKRCRDTVQGQDAVHDAKEEYLPRLKDQEDKEYDAYRKRATFYNAFWRTISGLTGMILRQPPSVETPESVKPLLDDVTMSGVPLQSMAQTVVEESLTEGRVGILVDVPELKAPENGAPATLADSKAQNIRPTLQLYETEAIINWRTDRVNNAMVLVLVVLKECELIPKDEYSSKAEDRWRELALVNGVYRVRLFRKRDKTQSQGGQVPGVDPDFEQIGTDIFPKMNAQPMNFIPFQFFSTDDLTSAVFDPPLIDLVNLNLAHYRVTADYEHGCHFTGLPTAWISGYKPENPGEKLYIGSAAAWVFPDPAAKAQFLEFTGQGLDTLLKNLTAKEQQMAVLGARMLEPQKKAPEAADSSSIRRKGEESMLAATAQTLSLGLTNVLKWFTQWAGATPDNVKFDFNRDFYPEPMTPEELNALVMAWQQGAISEQVLFENLQRGEVISRDHTLEEEQARKQDAQAQQFAQQLDQQVAQQQVAAEAPQSGVAA